MKLKLLTAFAVVSVAVLSTSGCGFGVLDNEYQYSVVQKNSSASDSLSALESSSSADASSSSSGSSKDESASHYEGFAFASADKSNGVVITEYNGQDKNAVVPSSIHGEKVVGIGEFAFGKEVERVLIPASVAEISPHAFDAALALHTIDIDGNNPNYCAFGGMLYSKDMSVLIRCPLGKQGQVTVEKGVAQIGRFAFFNCANVKEITLPDGIASIQACAFSNCKGLDSVFIPASVSFIAHDAFAGCTGLRDIYVSEDVFGALINKWVPSADCNVHFY